MEQKQIYTVRKLCIMHLQIISIDLIAILRSHQNPQKVPNVLAWCNDVSQLFGEVMHFYVMDLILVNL